MKRKYFKQRLEEQEAARERIRILFDLARQEWPKHTERAHHYARMIIETAKKMRLKLPDNIKRFICKECGRLLVPGKNLKVRSHEGFMIYECLNCGSKRKYGYLKEKKSR